MAEKNRVIGTPDGLPWNIPEEYQHFLNCVKGHTVIMGRKTYEIFGKDLRQSYEKKPESKLLIVSRTVKSLPDVEIYGSLEEAKDAAEQVCKPPECKIFCAGGASIYKQILEKGLADEMWLSHIKGDYEGTAYFPEFNEDEWDSRKEKDYGNWEFWIYKRKV